MIKNISFLCLVFAAIQCIEADNGSQNEAVTQASTDPDVEDDCNSDEAAAPGDDETEDIYTNDGTDVIYNNEAPGDDGTEDIYTNDGTDDSTDDDTDSSSSSLSASITAVLVAGSFVFL